jgi:hypothetical protein
LVERDTDHPADAVGIALVRANSILTAISNCFVDNKAQFAVNEPFVAQAVRAVEGLLADAGKQLDRLYSDVDLRWKADSAVAEGFQQPANMAIQEPEIELPARTYDELLRKLTAAEVFAADLSESESDLLPLLNDIKEVLQRNRQYG